MDLETIQQDLRRRFAAPLPEFYQRRIIFWYDERGPLRIRSGICPWTGSSCWY